MDHPVGQRQTNTPALTEARHHAARHPHARHPAHGAHNRIAIGGECERPVDDLFDACILKGREMFEPDFKAGRDPVDVGLQQLMAKVPWR